MTDTQAPASLRELAEAATPGPWRTEFSPADDGDDRADVWTEHPDYMCAIRELSVSPGNMPERFRNDAAFIAAANPAAILALEDERDALRAERDELRAENFALAAGQCIVDNGLIGDEHGNQVCTRPQKSLVDELRRLVTDMLENDPADYVSDGGHTVLDLWRHDARKALNSGKEGAA